MREPEELQRLVGGDVPPEELADLRRVDGLLRRTPAPPASVPGSLTHAVERIPEARRARGGRASLLAAVLAAVALAALAFALGRWTDGAGDVRATIPLAPTGAAPEAEGTIAVRARDGDSGNWGLRLDVRGLPRLPDGRYYVLWLAKDGEYAATCGTFNVRPEGTTRVELTASYRLADFDAWVVSEHGDDAPPLLEAGINPS